MKLPTCFRETKLIAYVAVYSPDEMNLFVYVVCECSRVVKGNSVHSIYYI